MKQPIQRDPADYGYPTPDVAALSAKALEVTQRLTTEYGEVPFSSKDPMSMLVDILLSHRTRDEQTAAAVGEPPKTLRLLGGGTRCTNPGSARYYRKC